MLSELFQGMKIRLKLFLKQNLKDNEKLRAKIQEILVPMEKVFEVKDGKKEVKQKISFPGIFLYRRILITR
jgi:transcription antitermination factor NusG